MLYYSLGLLCTVVLQLAYGSVVQEVDNPQQVDELDGSLQREKRFVGGYIFRTTSYTTTTLSTTISTAYFCYMKTYACGAGRRRRDIEQSDVLLELDNGNAEILDDFAEELRHVIKRSADNIGLDLRDFNRATWIPSRSLDADPRKLDDEEESIHDESVEKEDEDVGKARFFRPLITLKGTSTTTTTSTITSTVGTVGVTGATSECPSGSISDYLSKC